MKLDNFKTNDSIITVCFGERIFWDSRNEARRYFLEAMLSSSGEEKHHYSSVYSDIMKGLPKCTDNTEYKDEYYEAISVGYMQLSVSQR